MRFRTLLCLAFMSLLPRAGVAQIDQLQASYDFLMMERGAGGALINFSTRGGDYLLPASFYDTAAYWGAHVCGGSSAACAVNATYNSLSYQLNPAPGSAGKLQVERVNAHNGVNIYDASTWQIAVMLGFVKNKFRLSSTINPYALASNLSEVLRQSGIPPEANAAPSPCACDKRATTAGKIYEYNGSAVAEGKRAYMFRALAPEWIARDPLMNSPFAPWLTASNLPNSNPAYAAGKITWADWKPITGENAWAFLIGPLQSAHLHYVVFQKKQFIPFAELAVQNALDVLPTFAAMQSSAGGVYYAPAGTVGNEGDAPVNPHEISVENNFSLYAGLQILRATLQAQSQNDSSLSSADKNRINGALQLIDVMINGGKGTKGLLSFFKNAAWRNGVFVQGGVAKGGDWTPTTETKAVDVQTWGIAALGAKRIDEWFGAGASFALWRQLKTWGAYGEGKTLWGVGYSDRDGNGVDQGGAYRRGVLSGEWTAGAINAVRNMLIHYGGNEKVVASLKQDEAAMLAALNTLRIDKYASADFPGKPADYAKLVPMKTKPYLYASKRHHIPFGWYANPLPSTASTAWVIMIANNYDPFGVGGVPN